MSDERITPDEFRQQMGQGRRDFSGATITGAIEVPCDSEGLLFFRRTAVEGNMSIHERSLHSLDMTDLRVRGTLSIQDTSMGGLILNGGRAQGIKIVQTTVCGPAVLENLTVERFLNLRGTTFKKYLSIGGFTGPSMNMAEACVEGGILCGDDLATWLQCWSLFGKGVHVNHSAVKALVEKMLGGVVPAPTADAATDAPS